MDIINQENVPAIISPLHDPDKDKETDNEGAEGEVTRKPHYHVMLCYSGAQSREAVMEVTAKINATLPFRVKDKVKYARYLLHLDQPKKEQFKKGTMPTVFGNLDYLAIISSTKDSRDNTREIMGFVDRHDIQYFDVMAMYAAKNNESWFETITEKRTLFLKEFIKSRAYRVNAQLAEKGSFDDYETILSKIEEQENNKP